MLGYIHRSNHVALVSQVVGPADGRCQEATDPNQPFVFQHKLGIGGMANNLFPIRLNSIVEVL